MFHIIVNDYLSAYRPLHKRALCKVHIRSHCCCLVVHLCRCILRISFRLRILCCGSVCGFILLFCRLLHCFCLCICLFRHFSGTLNLSGVGILGFLLRFLLCCHCLVRRILLILDKFLFIRCALTPGLIYSRTCYYYGQH